MTEQLSNFREYLTSHGLKITPQRIAVFEAVTTLRNHPCVENIVEFVRQHHPNVSVGTVYNILETFVDNGLISKVKTDGDIMRYDTVRDKHHHLYSADSCRIEDYYDPGLDQILEDYFNKNEIPGFYIEDIKIQLMGKFIGKSEAHGFTDNNGKPDIDKKPGSPKGVSDLNF